MLDSFFKEYRHTVCVPVYFLIDTLTLQTTEDIVQYGQSIDYALKKGSLMKSASNVVHIGMRTGTIRKAMEDMFGRNFLDPSRMTWLAGHMEEHGMIRRRNSHMHINFLFATAFKHAVEGDRKNKRGFDINKNFEAAYKWQRHVLYEVRQTLSSAKFAAIEIDEDEVLIVSEFILDVGFIDPGTIVFMNRGRLGFFIKEYRAKRHLFFKRWWTACEHIYAQHEAFFMHRLQS